MTLSIAISIPPTGFHARHLDAEIYAGRLRTMALARVLGVTVFLVASVFATACWPGTCSTSSGSPRSARRDRELLQALLIVLLASRLGLAYAMDSTATASPSAPASAWPRTSTMSSTATAPCRALSRVLSVSLMHARPGWSALLPAAACFDAARTAFARGGERGRCHVPARRLQQAGAEPGGPARVGGSPVHRAIGHRRDRVAHPALARPGTALAAGGAGRGSQRGRSDGDRQPAADRPDSHPLPGHH